MEGRIGQHQCERHALCVHGQAYKKPSKSFSIAPAKPCPLLHRTNTSHSKFKSSQPHGRLEWSLAAETTAGRPLRLIQHKDEAFWFYRFLSIVYDKVGGSRQLQDPAPDLHSSLPKSIEFKRFSGYEVVIT